MRSPIGSSQIRVGWTFGFVTCCKERDNNRREVLLPTEYDPSPNYDAFLFGYFCYLEVVVASRSISYFGCNRQQQVLLFELRSSSHILQEGLSCLLVARHPHRFFLLTQLYSSRESVLFPWSLRREENPSCCCGWMSPSPPTDYSLETEL